MRSILRLVALAPTVLITLSLTGCFTAATYTRDVAKATPNSYDKLPGIWSYTIDDSLRSANRTGFKPTGLACSLHNYSLNAGDQLASAASRMLDDITGGKKEDATNTIAVRLDTFAPKFSCAAGITEGTCTGTAEIALLFTVVKDGKRSNFTVSSERNSDSPSGAMCDKALDAPAEATRKAIKDVLERASERLTAIADK
jgi:hypothetical protein